MFIRIDNQSSDPIYFQIAEAFKREIARGGLQADEALPSIRNLAKDLRISVITTKRAYEELEKEGYIYTVAGKGCFVSPRNEELVREERLKEMESHLARAAGLAQLKNAKMLWNCFGRKNDERHRTSRLRKTLSGFHLRAH